MKPYVVEITVRTVVMAHHEAHAQLVAEEKFSEIARDVRPEVSIEKEVRGQSDLPDGWDLDCLPYGGDGNTRLAGFIGKEAVNS